MTDHLSSPLLAVHVRVGCTAQYCISTIAQGQAVQNFHDALELKDSEIYCQRAKKLYSSPESSLQMASLFQFSMSGTKILGMFDPSMLGREKLVECLTEMDSIR